MVEVELKTHIKNHFLIYLPKSFDSFQVLDQTIFGGHSFGSQSQTDSNGGNKTFWDISDNDTNQEHNSSQPVVTLKKLIL